MTCMHVVHTPTWPLEPLATIMMPLQNRFQVRVLKANILCSDIPMAFHGMAQSQFIPVESHKE